MKAINDKITPDNNDDSDVHNDEIGENTGDDTVIAKDAKLKPGEQDSGQSQSSNKEQGPKGEDL